MTNPSHLPLALRRKLSPPQPPEGDWRRDTLLQQLQVGFLPTKRLTLVQGGAGTGKTTLLADYFRQKADPGLWYSLSPSENDPVVFFRQLLLGLACHFPAISSAALEIIETLGSRGLVQAMSLLCSELPSHRTSCFLLILDDVQHLPQTEEALKALEILVANWPEDAQLIMSGREPPPLKTASYQLRNQVVEIGADTLALTPPEISQWLLERTGKPPAANLVDQLFERTGGWITGLMYALEGEGEPRLDRLEKPEILFSYLSEEIFDHLPPEFKTQLLSTAFLPQLDLDLCRSLFGTTAESFLETISQNRTFITQSSTGFQFHPIFKDFLQRETLALPNSAQRKEILMRQGSALGSPEESIRLLLLAGEWQEAEHLLVSTFVSLLRAGRLETIRSNIAGFPLEWQKQSAWLGYLQGEIARRDGQLSRAIELLSEAEPQASKSSGFALPWILAGLAAAYGARGDIDKQWKYSQQALAIQPPPPNVVLGFCYNVLGLYHLSTFDLDSAKTSLQKAMDLYRETDDTDGLARVLHNLGLSFAKAGHFYQAIGYYLESIRQAECGGRIPMPMTLSNLAMCHLYLGQLAEGWNALGKGMALAERIASKRDRIYLNWTLGQFQLHQDQVLKAIDALELSLGEAIETGDHLSQINAHLGLAEAHLHQQDSQAAAASIERTLTIANKSLHDPDMLEAALLQAEIDLKTDRYKEAEELLQTVSGALRLSPNHYQSYHVARLSYQCAVSLGQANRAESHLSHLHKLCAQFGYPAPELSAFGVSTPAMELNCLGHFEVRIEGELVPYRNWRSINTRIVLTYLLLTPSGTTKDNLLDLLYPDEEPARSTVHMVITRLRQALEPDLGKGQPSRFILFRDSRYFFNQGLNIRCDVWDFQQACLQARRRALSAEDRMALYMKAIRLYQGPFLEDFQDQSWCMFERERLRRLAMEAYEELFCLLAKKDDWHSLETVATDLLKLEPGSNSGYRANMVALAMQEHIESALRIANIAQHALSSQHPPALEQATQELIDLLQEDRLTIRSARSFLPSRQDRS